MSRPKSPASLALERDRAIRHERRERKHKEREAKQEARLKRQLTLESVVKNGIPKVQSGGTELGIHDAIAYSPYVLCAGCRNAIRESAMIGSLCERCHYSEEVNDEGLKLEANRAVPGTEAGGKNGTVAPAGQLTLEL